MSMKQDSFTRTNAESLITLGTMFMLNGAAVVRHLVEQGESNHPTNVQIQMLDDMGKLLHLTDKTKSTTDDLESPNRTVADDVDEPAPEV